MVWQIISHSFMLIIFLLNRACRRIHEEVIQTSYLSLRLLFSLGFSPDVHSDPNSLLSPLGRVKAPAFRRQL
jgi:hypothetical protein